MRSFIYILLFFFVFTGSAQQKQLSLEDAVWGRYTYLNSASQNFIWQNEHTFSFVKNDTLWLENAKSSEKVAGLCLLGLNKITGYDFRRFPSFSWPSENVLLVQSAGRYFLLDIQQKQLISKIVLPENAENAEFSYTGKMVAFTIADNLFVAFENGETQQITSDGGNGIVNGKTVHRSEFGITNGIFMAPKGNYIAFYRKDESMVKDYPLVDFMAREAEYTPVKYPMAGMTSHHVTLGVYDIQNQKTTFLKTGEPLDHYLTNIAWSPNEKQIYIAELNREQNHMQMNVYDVTTGEKQNTLFEEKSTTYVEPLFPIQFSKVDENYFYYLSRKDGWFHLYKYNTKGEFIQQITKGEWEITSLLGFDKKEKYVFVEGTKESPLENHIYRVEIKSGKVQKLSETSGIHQASLSADASFIIDSWNAPEEPGKTDVLTNEGKFIRTIYQKENTLKEYVLGENKLVDILSADGKPMLSGRLILPPNLNEPKKNPVKVYVYGGPHSQLVNKSWHNQARWWQYYMASKGFIAFTMDNRGTSNRGRDFETAVHRQLGVLETEDQMKGIEYLRSLSFVDAERIGVHGWSYGGFMTLNLMLRHPEIFKVGVAGGPVVDWSMYEIMYGERYMDMPQENEAGYENSNMLNYVNNLQGKLMLIHGVQDQTVVMQHSMKFLRECVKQNKQVDFFVYPIHPHNVRGKERVHLMEKVSRYFFDYL